MEGVTVETPRVKNPAPKGRGGGHPGLLAKVVEEY
jgi:hypothetical protein